MQQHLLVMLAVLCNGVLAIEILSLDIPFHVRIGHQAVLFCNYEMGQDELYSVKWYKGKDEFYRHVPKDKPPGQVFTLNGISVNHTASNNHQVVLENVTMATSGKYKCEVSAEAPSFQTVFQEQDMVVVDVPKQRPTISGGHSRYQVGSTVNVNCSAVYVSPKASLEWFINDEKALDDITHLFPPFVDANGVETSILSLQFTTRESHFTNGGLTLRCVSSLLPFFSTSNEHSAIGDHNMAPILESKGNIGRDDGFSSSSSRVSSEFICCLDWIIMWLLYLLQR